MSGDLTCFSCRASLYQIPGTGDWVNPRAVGHVIVEPRYNGPMAEALAKVVIITDIRNYEIECEGGLDQARELRDEIACDLNEIAAALA